MTEPDAVARPDPTDLIGVLRTGRVAFQLVLRAARPELLVTLTLTVVGSALTAAELLVGRRLVQLVTDGEAVAAELTPWLLLLGALLIVSALVRTAVDEIQILLHELVRRESAAQILRTASGAELEAFEDPSFHDQVKRARDDADTHAWQVVWGLVTLLSTLTSVVAVVAVLLGVAPLLVPLAALAYVPIAWAGARNTRALYGLRYGLAQQERDRDYHERLLTGRLEAKEVRAFGLADWLLSRHDSLAVERVRRTRRVVRRRTLFALLGSSVTAVMLVGTLGVVLALAIAGRIEVGDAAVAVVGLQQLASRLRGMGEATTSMVEGVAFLRDFETFRRSPRARPSAAGGRSTSTPPARPHRVSLEGVRYRYPAGDGDVLSDVDLDLEPGRVVALVGPNGSGKSTLAKVVCGLLPPSAGAIRWDGVDVRDFDPKAVRALVAPVFQDFTRFEHTVHETIAFGDVDEMDDTDRVRRAAERAGVDRFVNDLSAGYDTRLSTSFDGGTELSVGQWQRLAVARAFFRDAPLIVMDEPSASLDPLAEQALFDRLQDLGRDRMVLFISHRFATVHRADHIVVLVDGRIAEQGDHRSLMDLQGLYADMYRLQAGQFG